MKYEMQMISISNLHVPELRKTKTGFIGVNNMNLSSHTKSLTHWLLMQFKLMRTSYELQKKYLLTVSHEMFRNMPLSPII